MDLIASPAPHAFMVAMASYADVHRSPGILTEREQKVPLQGGRIIGRRATVQRGNENHQTRCTAAVVEGTVDAGPAER